MIEASIPTQYCTALWKSFIHELEWNPQITSYVH